MLLPLPSPAHRVDENSDRKSTRLNSSHQIISYAVFCLKKKKKETIHSIAPHTTRHPSCPPPQDSRAPDRHRFADLSVTAVPTSRPAPAQPRQLSVRPTR